MGETPQEGPTITYSVLHPRETLGRWSTEIREKVFNALMPLAVEIFARIMSDQQASIDIIHRFNEIYLQNCNEAAAWIREKIGYKPIDLYIILGSGLQSLPQHIIDKITHSFKFTDIRHFPIVAAPGHNGYLHIAEIDGLRIAIQEGRVHYYDGWVTPAYLRNATLPIKVAKALGAKNFLVTNAVGVVNNGKVKVGDIVAITGELSSLGASANPTVGPQIPCFGSRFIGRDKIISKRLFRLFYRAMESSSQRHPRLGIYRTGGPHYESLPEVAAGMLYSQPRRIVSCFGMSLGPELAAILESRNLQPGEVYDPLQYGGLDRPAEVLVLSVATNIIPKPKYQSIRQLLRNKVIVANPTSEEEVIAQGKKAEAILIPAVIEFCKRLAQQKAELMK